MSTCRLKRCTHSSSCQDGTLPPRQSPDAGTCVEEIRLQAVRTGR